MKTGEFISELRRALSNLLIFVDLDGHAVHRGYHLTELKAVSLHTVDCGGQTNQWEGNIPPTLRLSHAGPHLNVIVQSLLIFNQISGLVPLILVNANPITYIHRTVE